MPRLLRLVLTFSPGTCRDPALQGSLKFPRAVCGLFICPPLSETLFSHLHDTHELASSPNTPKPLCLAPSAFHSFIQAFESGPASGSTPSATLTPASLCFLCWWKQTTFSFYINCADDHLPNQQNPPLPVSIQVLPLAWNTNYWPLTLEMCLLRLPSDSLCLMKLLLASPESHLYFLSLTELWLMPFFILYWSFIGSLHIILISPWMSHRTSKFNHLFPLLPSSAFIYTQVEQLIPSRASPLVHLFSSILPWLKP